VISGGQDERDALAVLTAEGETASEVVRRLLLEAAERVS